MKTRSTNQDDKKFEAWAKLLICRKVPDGFRDVVNSDVVHEGAVILKYGGAFEVHIREQSPGVAEKRVFVTPFPSRTYRRNLTRARAI
jgi:hypothetical protein